MTIIAVSDIETRGAVERAAEELGATSLKFLSGIFYTLIVIFSLMYVNVCTCNN